MSIKADANALMLNNSNFEDLIFFDIETAPLAPELSGYPIPLQDAWEYTFNRPTYIEKYNKNHDGKESLDYEACFDGETSLKAEFSKVICIACMEVKDGVITNYRNWIVDGLMTETQMLIEFGAHVGRRFLCGKNIKNFEIPFICKRMQINDVKPPSTLDIAGKKPWEIQHVDVDDYWTHGAIRPQIVSLHVMCACLGIESPKNEIDGSQIGKLYYSNEEDRMKRIQKYCAKDVFATINVLRRMNYLPLVTTPTSANNPAKK